MPVASDEVIFDNTSVVAPLTGMAIGDTGGVDFDLLHFKSTYTGGIGATQVPLHTSAQKIIIEGSGTYYIEIAEDATGKDQVVPLVIINNSNAIVYLTGEEATSSWVCEITDLFVIACAGLFIGNDGTAANAIAVKNLHIAPRENKANNVTVTIDSDCERLKVTTYAMNVYMANGAVTSDSAAALIDMCNGSFLCGTEAGGGSNDVLIAELRLHDGTFTWVPDDAGGAPAITTAYIIGGNFTADSTVNDDVAKTITTVYTFPRSTFNIRNNRGNITVTSWYDHGATSKIDVGGKVAVTYNQP